MHLIHNPRDATEIHGSTPPWLTALLVVAILALAAGAIAYTFQKQHQTESTRLSTISDLKAQQLNNWLAERWGDATYLQGDPHLPDLYHRWRRQGDAESRDRMLARLKQLATAYNYSAILVLDEQGEQLAAMGKTGEDPDPILLRTTLRSVTQKRVLSTDLYRSQQPAHPLHLDFVVPLAGRNGEHGPVIVLRSHAEDFLFAGIQTWPVPSASGETLIFRRSGEQVQFLNELRHRKGTALALNLPISAEPFLAARILAGEAKPGEFLEGVDYRGERVVGVAREIVGMNWFLITKIDRDEMYAPALSAALLILLVAAAMIVAGMALLAASRQRQALEASRAIRQAQEEKLGALHLLESIAEGSSDAIFAKDRNSRHLLFNQGAEKLTGVSRAQAIGHGPEVIFPPDQAEIVRQNDLEVMDAEAARTFEETLVTRDGTRTLLATKGPLRDSEGHVIGLFGISRDITKQKQAELALRISEDLSRSIMDSLSSALVVLDERGIIMRVNLAWRCLATADGGCGLLRGGTGTNYFALCRENMPGEPMAAQALSGLEAVRDGAAPSFHMEYSCHAQAARRWFLMSARPLLGTVKGLVVSHENITQRKLAELDLAAHKDSLETLVAARTQELDNARAQAELILASTADGLFGMDMDGCLTFINPAGCAMLGYTQEQLVGRHVHPAIHHSRPDGTPYPHEECPMMRALLEGHAIHSDGDVLWHADGRPVPVAYATQPMIADGKKVGAVVSFRDITLERETNRAREGALAEAERLARIRSEFLANMSHEIRTPLNGILGLAQVGIRANEGNKSGGIFHRILDSGQVLLGIVNDVLDFSKIEAGKLELEWSRFKLGEVIDQAVEMTAIRAQAKGLDFRVEEAANLPPVWVGDPLRLTQILANLLTNAIKFTPRGRITLSARSNRKGLVLRVDDTGIGLTEQQIARLFTPFEQADGSTTRRFGGTGLGLSICRRLVDLMGGAISVRSRPGRGTRFEVSLPLSRTEHSAAPARGSVVLAGLSQVESETLTKALEARGIGVTVATPQTAFETNADLVLLANESLGEYAPGMAENAAGATRKLALVCDAGMTGQPLPTPLERSVIIERPIRARHVLAALAGTTGAGTAALRVEPRLTAVRVLAAEDNEVNRVVLEEILSQEGARLTCADTGRAALERLLDDGVDAYDVVLTDIQMPLMDGYELATRIGQMAPDLPVIGLTAHALEEERERSRAAGMVEHITKPVDVDTLVAAILRHARVAGAPQPETPREPAGTGAGGMRPTGLIDHEGLGIRFKHDRSFLHKLATTVLQTNAEVPGKLREAAERLDFATLTNLAHGLKGMSGNLMIREMQNLAAEAEQAARRSDQAAPGLALKLAALLETVLTELDAYARSLEHEDATP